MPFPPRATCGPKSRGRRARSGVLIGARVVARMFFGSSPVTRVVVGRGVREHVLRYHVLTSSYACSCCVRGEPRTASSS